MSGDVKGAGAATLFAMGIQTGGFKSRLFGYFLFYVILVVALMVFIFSISKNIPIGSESHIKILMTYFFLFGGSVLPFILWERSIRKFRRSNNLSVYGDIREELEQREIDERVRKEHKAFVNNGIAKEGGSVADKSDIGYWFGLFERGAISKEEYEAKKNELL